MATSLYYQRHLQQIQFKMGEYTLKDALAKVSMEGHLSNGLKNVQIEDVWLSVVGKTIAKYTEKVHVVKKTLFVTTYNAALKNELLFQKETIIERINDAFAENFISDVFIN